MESHTHAVPNAVNPVLLNILALALGWLVVMAFGTIGRAGGFIGITLGLSTACLVAVLIALTVRARAAAVLAAGMAVNGVLELVVHVALGREAVQGAQAHFAVMAAATLGAALGVSPCTIERTMGRRLNRCGIRMMCSEVFDACAEFTPSPLTPSRV